MGLDAVPSVYFVALIAPQQSGGEPQPLADTLTESFCERCGTRYEFKAPTRLNPLRKTRGMVGGLKNYLTSQDSFSDSLSDSMRTEQGALASAQLEAFHESFNFCIDCRQYTCLNCWNDDAGRCRTCLPMAGTDDVPDSMPAAPVTGTEVMATDALQARMGLEAWPTTDLPSAPVTDQARRVEAWPAAELLAESDAVAEPADSVLADDGFVYDTPRIELDEPEPLIAEVEPEPLVAEVEPEPEPLVAEVEVEPEPVVGEVEVEPEPVVAEVEPEPEPVVAEVVPEPELVAEVEPEPVIAEVEPEPEPELVAEAEPQTEPAVAQRPPLRILSWEPDGAYDVEAAAIVAEVEPEPVVAEVEPEPEPVVAEVEPEPEPVVAEVEPEPEPVVAEVEPEPEPVVAEVEPEPEPVVAEVEPEPVAAFESERRTTVGPISQTILRFPERQAASATGTRRGRRGRQSRTRRAACSARGSRPRRPRHGPGTARAARDRPVPLAWSRSSAR